MATVLVARIVAVRCLLVVVAVVVVGLVSTAVMVMDVVDGQLRGLLVLNCAVDDVVHKGSVPVILVGLDGPAHDGLGASEVEEDSLDYVRDGAVFVGDCICDNATVGVLVMAFTSIFVKLSHIVDLRAHLGFNIAVNKVRPDPESDLIPRSLSSLRIVDAGLDSLAGNLRKLNFVHSVFPTDSVDRLVLGEGLVCFLGRRVLLVWGVPVVSVCSGVGVHVIPWVVTDIVIGIVRGGVAFQRVVMRGSLDGNHSEGNGNDRIHLLVWYVILNFSN